MDGTYSERGDWEYLRWTVIISLALCQARKKRHVGNWKGRFGSTAWDSIDVVRKSVLCFKTLFSERA